MLQIMSTRVTDFTPEKSFIIGLCVTNNEYLNYWIHYRDVVYYTAVLQIMSTRVVYYRAYWLHTRDVVYHRAVLQIMST